MRPSLGIAFTPQRRDARAGTLTFGGIELLEQHGSSARTSKLLVGKLGMRRGPPIPTGPVDLAKSHPPGDTSQHPNGRRVAIRASSAASDHPSTDA